jgi:uncharacterized membrane protein YqgA involved in biofilm formation
MLGTLVNTLAIIAGSFLGLFCKKGIPVAWQTTIVQGMGIAVGVIGVGMALKGNMLIAVSSIALGGILGEWLALDKKLDNLGLRLASLVRRLPLGTGGNVQEGFVMGSLLYCIGAMSIVGSIEDSLAGNHSILFVKSMLDGIMAIFLTSSLGIGVMFSALSVLLYQGAISLLAGLLAPFLSAAVVAEISSTGGVLICGIALVMLKVVPVKLANLLPALVFAAVIAIAAARLG